MARQHIIVNHMEDAWPQRLRSHNLYRITAVRDASSEEAIVALEERRVDLPRLARQYGLTKSVVLLRLGHLVAGKGGLNVSLPRVRAVVLVDIDDVEEIELFVHDVI